MSVVLKRVYEDPSPDDGYRVLVDRLWPRGVRKDELDYDEWAQDVAPSADLRKSWHPGEFAAKDSARSRALVVKAAIEAAGATTAG